MKKFKPILAILLAWMLCTSCYYSSPPPPPYTSTYQPQAALGYDNGIYGATVTDARGEQFFMDYILYNQLMSHGGYNAVDRYYYSNPSSTSVHVYNASAFKADNSPRAQAYRVNFNKSYNTTVTSHQVYEPSQQAVSRTVKLKTQVNGSAYRPNTASPAPMNVSPTQSTSAPVNLSRPSSSPSPIASTVNLNKPASSTPAPSSTPVNLSKPAARPTTTASASRPVSFSSRSSSSRSSSRH